jgi:hypothetical protein
MRRARERRRLIRGGDEIGTNNANSSCGRQMGGQKAAARIWPTRALQVSVNGLDGDQARGLGRRPQS